MSLYRSQSWLIVAVVVVIAVAAAWGWKQLGNSTPATTTADPSGGPALLITQLYPQPKALKPFRLQDQHGSDFDNARLQGKWTVLFFGYTSCPDICPTTLASMARVAAQLTDAERAQLQFVFITVDPQRDTVEQLAQYLPFFKFDVTGLTGSEDIIAALTADLGVAYLRVPQAGDSAYLVDHSVRLFVLNPQGERHALMSPEGMQGFAAEKVLADLRAVAR